MQARPCGGKQLEVNAFSTWDGVRAGAPAPTPPERSTGHHRRMRPNGQDMPGMVQSRLRILALRKLQVRALRLLPFARASSASASAQPASCRGSIGGLLAAEGRC